MRARRTGLLACVAALLVATSCSVVADLDVKGKGIGSACASDADCHAGACSGGVCVASCSVDGDCPSPSRCFAQQCSLPLNVGALWVGVVSGGEGWTLTHDQGMRDAAKTYPWIQWTSQENVVPNSGVIASAIDGFVKSGAQVIVANSTSQRDEVLAKASQYPDVKFLVCEGFKSNGANAKSYAGHFEQAWFVTGQVAAQKATKRICAVASFITPEVVRYVNAFHLGARSVSPNIVTEVAWIGFWSDYQTLPTYDYGGTKLYREELLTARMIASGCQVVAHLADNQRSVRYVESQTAAGKISGVWSFSNDNPDGYRANTPAGPGAPLSTCLGGPYWSWGPLYAAVLSDIHRGVWDASTEVLEPWTATSSSLFGFQLNPNVGIDDSSVRSLTTQMVQAGPDRVYSGPYETTGQRDADGDGVYDSVQSVGANEKLSNREYDTMCWFAKGIVEKQDPLDPSSPDRDAHVPDDHYPPPSDVLGPPGAPPGVAVDCRKNY